MVFKCPRNTEKWNQTKEETQKWWSLLDRWQSDLDTKVIKLVHQLDASHWAKIECIKLVHGFKFSKEEYMMFEGENTHQSNNLMSKWFQIDNIYWSNNLIQRTSQQSKFKLKSREISEEKLEFHKISFTRIFNDHINLLVKSLHYYIHKRTTIKDDSKKQDKEVR